MENNAYINRIHQYLSGKMGQAEKSDFEHEMNANEQLANDTKIEEKLLLGISLVGDDDLKKNIASADQHLSAKHFFETGRVVSLQPNRFIMKKLISIAAAAVILIGLVWWGFFRQTTPSADQLFADNFKAEKIRSVALADALTNSGLVDSMTTEDSLLVALKFYNDGKYNEAMVALDTFLVYHPANDTAQFYLAMTHLNESRYARAVELLTPITYSEVSSFKLDAMWYLGLCYFKVEGGFSKAEEIFTQLASTPESKDQQAAKGILRSIGH
ncbi:MAG: tetratricopeptide repeat protein [Saprospiraceae bacterium]|nr:tetratricopeptide repeat protein [Saprospiraceae bacterium]MCF8251347.1 tetratricopeptide repeat protein [Saprospiraceae bacterium]MCF8280522.1 tetratricopeptide repeat protein [Bacteroidales bacterium]MCF8313260.1 tetratricopeptide repeat protein [Saprospiraceae bacterium]MCF8441707.1 tetratricopeptide repeat protein [Saprospiraceae bacterium]